MRPQVFVTSDTKPNEQVGMTERDVVDKISRRYAKKCWWAEISDLRQEGWTALLEARKRFDPKRGTPFSAFAWVCVEFSIRNYLWEQSAPVTGPKHRGRKLEGLQRTPVKHIRNVPAPSDPTAAEEWWARIREALDAAVLDGRGGHIAAAVLLDGARPAEMASETKVPVTKIYGLVDAAKRRVKSDDTICEMLSEGTP